MDVRGWRGSTLTAGDGVHPRRRPGLQGLSRARAESCNGLMSTTAREQGETRGAMGPLGGLCSRGVILSRLEGPRGLGSYSSPAAPAAARTPSLGGVVGNGVLCAQLLSHVRLFVTPWSVAWQAPLSVGFSSKNTRQGCHTLLQGIFTTQIEPMSSASPALQADSLPPSHQGSTKTS